MNKQEAENLLIEAINNIYCHDKELFDYNGKNYERAIAFRLAHYLQNIIDNEKEFESDIKIDCEYERHYTEKKQCFVPCHRCNSECDVAILRKKSKLPKTMRPDIIIHKRRSNEKNLLAIEIKTPNRLPRNPDSKDNAKLTYITCSKSNRRNSDSAEWYHYNIGIALCLTREAYKFWIFEKGKRVEPCEKRLFPHIRTALSCPIAP